MTIALIAVWFVISLAVSVWWFATFEPSSKGKAGSLSYFYSPLMPYVWMGLIASGWAFWMELTK